jgi:hypothetical protein
MKVPTQEQFTEWLEASVRPVGLTTESLNDEDPDRIRKILHEALVQHRKLRQQRLAELY